MNKGGHTMLEVKLSLPQVRDYIKNLILTPEKIFAIDTQIKTPIADFLNNLMELEITLFLGRQKYERIKHTEKNWRNGYRDKRFILKGIGEITVRVLKRQIK